MTRIKIKCSGSSDRGRKLKLLEILCRNDVHITRIFTAHDGFAVLAINEDHGDKIFSRVVKSTLEDEGFNPLMPAELKVKKSVILTRVDEVIYDNDEVDIGEQLMAKNIWIQDELHSVYKFPNSNTIKLTSQTSLAKKRTETGLRAFGISITSHEIRQETYITIKCCMRCYQLEEHNTRESTKSKNYKVCSECSTEGHLWYECRERNKICLNCNENHSTLAMKCPKKKAILKEKRKEEIEKQKMSYSDVTRVQSNMPTHTTTPFYPVCASVSPL